MLHQCISTEAQSRQTKHWLCKIPFVFLPWTLRPTYLERQHWDDSTTPLDATRAYTNTDWINESSHICPPHTLMFFLLWLSFSCRFAFSQHAVSSSRYSGSDGLCTAPSTANGIWWYVLWLHCLFEFIQRCFSVDLKSLVLTGGPPYPPNQYGGGRGNYDNFRGQGGYLGKPRNIRWDHCTCDLYLAVSNFCYWRNLKLLF